MKKQFLFPLLLVAIIAVFSSCKKESVTGTPATSGYYMKFKIGGVQKTYPGSAVTFLTTGGYYAASIAGGNATGQESLGFSLYSVIPIVAGATFTGNPVQPGVTLPKVIISYVSLTSGTHSYSSLRTDNTGELIITPANVKITELTATTIKGTFYGDTYDVNSGTKQSVSDGEFYGIRQ